MCTYAQAHTHNQSTNVIKIKKEELPTISCLLGCLIHQQSNRGWLHMPVIPALGSEGRSIRSSKTSSATYEFGACLSYMRSCFKATAATTKLDAEVKEFQPPSFCKFQAVVPSPITMALN